MIFFALESLLLSPESSVLKSFGLTCGSWSGLTLCTIPVGSNHESSVRPWSHIALVLRELKKRNEVPAPSVTEES